MDKKKLQLIVLGVLGVIILVIGVGAATIYNSSIPREALDSLSQSFYGAAWDELTTDQQAYIYNWYSPPSIQEKNAQFREWLAKPLKWIGIGFGVFLILTAALVVSRVISNRLRPPSDPS